MMMMKKKKKKSPLLSHPPKRHRTSNLVDVPYEPYEPYVPSTHALHKLDKCCIACCCNWQLVITYVMCVPSVAWLSLPFTCSSHCECLISVRVPTN